MKIISRIKIMFFVLLLPFLGLGQTSKVKKTASFEEIVKLFATETNEIEKEKLAKLYLDKAKASNKPNLIARGFYFYTLLYYDSNPSKAIFYYDSIIKYSVDINDEYYPAVAFCEKAGLLVSQNKFKEAIKNYNLAEFYAKKNNLDYYYTVRLNIGVIKSENLGETEEALKIFQECYSFYKTKNVADSKYSDNYLNSLFGLADEYKALNKIDSCSYYNRLGYKESNRLKKEDWQYLFALNEGANQITNKNYKVAKDSIDISLPKMIEYKNSGNILASYFYLGKLNEGLKNYTAAKVNYLKVDSLFTITKDITPEFIDGYSFLIDYYKKKGDVTNQLKYITKLMTIDSTLNLKYKKLDKLLQKEYDFPHLMVEKESLIKSLKNENSISYVGIGVFGLIILGLILYVRRQKKQELLNQLRFDEIIKKIQVDGEELKDSATLGEREKSEQKQEINSKTIEIAPELVKEILAQLQLFENNKQFLQSNITAQLLANQFKTNIKYLSKIINEYKNKPFIQYVNDLRVDCALKELQKDKRLRNYTITALANEFGFNSAESFNSAFYKKTEIRATFYIEKLDNIILAKSA